MNNKISIRLFLNVIIIAVTFMNTWNTDYQNSLMEDAKVMSGLARYGYSGAHVDETVKNSAYDAVVYKGSREYLIEIKHDFRAAETQNFFIETGNSKGKKSGLTTTEASHYILCVPQSGIGFAIKTDDLRAVLLQGREISLPTMGRLVRVKTIAQYSKTFTYGDSV
jgi:hypothetical protein